MSQRKRWWTKPVGQWPKPILALMVAVGGFFLLGIIGAIFFPEPSDPKRSAKVTTTQTQTESRPKPRPAPSKPQPTTTARKPAKQAPRPRPTETASTPRRRPKPAKKLKRKPDPAAQAQRYYLAVDDAAMALDTGIGQALDGDAGGAVAIARARKRISARLTARLLDGGDTSIATNLLLSAASQAQEAIRSKDLARLADARREVNAARRKLAAELGSP